MTNSIIYDDWLSGQISKATDKKRRYPKAFVGERPYLHFDPKLYFPRVGKDVSQEASLRELLTDGENILHHGFLPFILNDIRTRKFIPRPLLIAGHERQNQKLFPHIKSRPTMYASHKDACIFSFYSYVLQLKYEAFLKGASLDTNIIAYRSIDHKNNIDFAKAAFEFMSQTSAFDCIMVDIKGFFDNINHHLLRQRWDELLDGGFEANKDHEKIYRAVTTYRFVDNRTVIDTLKANKRPYLVTERGCKKMCSLEDYNRYVKKLVRTNRKSYGIPQGSPISGTLANLYLSRFDLSMKDLVENQLGGLYQRYSDDILVVIPNGQAKLVYTKINEFIKKEKLHLGPKKTEAFRKESDSSKLANITNLVDINGNDKRDSPQYLGFHFDGESIVLRPSTVGKHFRKPMNFSYMSASIRKIGEPRIAGQVNKIRLKIKNRNKRV